MVEALKLVRAGKPVNFQGAARPVTSRRTAISSAAGWASGSSRAVRACSSSTRSPERARGPSGTGVRPDRRRAFRGLPAGGSRRGRGEGGGADGGDDLRRWPPVSDGYSENFASINRNKRSIAIDLKDAAQVGRLKSCAG